METKKVELQRTFQSKAPPNLPQREAYQAEPQLLQDTEREENF